MPHPPSGVGVSLYKLKQIMDDGQQDYSLSKKCRNPGQVWVLSDFSLSLAPQINGGFGTLSK